MFWHVTHHINTDSTHSCEMSLLWASTGLLVFILLTGNCCGYGTHKSIRQLISLILNLEIIHNLWHSLRTFYKLTATHNPNNRLPMTDVQY